MPWFFDYYGRTVSIVDPVIFGKNSNCWDSPAFSLISNSSFGDMDGDGQPEILCGTTGASAGLSFLLLGYRVPFQHHLSIWNLGKKGTYLDAFPRRIDDYQFLANPIVADLDGDGLKEAIIGTGGYIIHAFNKNGIEPSCFPKFTGGWLISVPSVGDINGDHLLELVAMTREGYVFAWVTTGLSEPGSVDWSGFHGDIRNTGCYMP
jgi:hypothetical protein